MTEVVEFGGRPKHLPAGTLLSAGRVIYQKHFWFFLVMFAPAAAVSFGFYHVTNQRSAEYLSHHYGDAAFLRHWWIFLIAGSIRLAGAFLSWTLYCFLFTGVSEAVRQFDAGSEIGIEESLRPIREHPIPFLVASSIQFALFVLTVWISILVGVFLAVKLQTSAWGTTGITLIGVCFGLAVYSRWALALPAFTQEDFRPVFCLRRSTELGAYVELPIILLLIEAVLATYAALYVPSILLAWAGTHTSLPLWADWISFGLSTAMVLVIEPILFIGLSVAYFRARDQERAEQSTMAAAGIESF